MKIAGYEGVDIPSEEIKFIELAAVQLEATPEELRKIATFLNTAADDMDSMGSVYDHEHLSDKQPGFENSPYVVILRSPTN
jgi:hypothetical protein